MAGEPGNTKERLLDAQPAGSLQKKSFRVASDAENFRTAKRNITGVNNHVIQAQSG